MRQQRSIISKLIEWLEDYESQLLTWIGGVGFTLSGIWSVLEKENFNFHSGTSITFLISLTIYALGSFKTWKRTKSNKALQREVARLENQLGQVERDYFRTFEIQLESLSNQLNFTDKERISIYKHNGRHFLLIGRYSKNPSHDKRGRVIYADYEGCIGEAWSKGEAFDSNLSDPLSNEPQYLQHMKSRWMLNENITRNLTMKSRSCAAYALDNFQIPVKRNAVIVFESLDPHKITKNSLESIAIDDKLLVIRQLLETMKLLEPSLSRAEQEGY